MLALRKGIGREDWADSSRMTEMDSAKDRRGRGEVVRYLGRFPKRSPDTSTDADNESGNVRIQGRRN